MNDLVKIQLHGVESSRSLSKSRPPERVFDHLVSTFQDMKIVRQQDGPTYTQTDYLPRSAGTFLYAVRIDNDRTRAFYINLTSEFEPRGPGVRITKAVCPVVQMAPCFRATVRRRS